MNFTNTDRAKIQVYGQFQIRHQVNEQVGWHVDYQVDDYVIWHLDQQIYPIQTKIEQEMKK